MLKKEIEDLLSSIQMTILHEEKSLNENALIIKLRFYQKARKTTEAAKELLEDISQHEIGPSQDALYRCLLEGLEKLKNVIESPNEKSTENLLTYLADNTYSDQQYTNELNNYKKNKFKAFMSGLLGVVVIGGYIAFAVLFLPVFVAIMAGTVGTILGLVHLLSAKLLLDAAHTKQDKLNEKLNLPFYKAKHIHSQGFFTKLSGFSQCAQKINQSVRKVYDEKIAAEKPQMLNQIMRA